jgi:ferritin-like metal-binding protein YciE
MKIQSFNDLFVHDLKDMYYAENELLDALDTLAEQTSDEDIVEAFESHRSETEEHVSRLEEVFELVGEEPSEEQCEGIDGLLKEHEDFVSEDPEQAQLELHNLVAAQKTEHYEIAAYENMMQLADRLGMDEARDLIESNLTEERAALDTLSTLVEDLDVEMAPGAATSD